MPQTELPYRVHLWFVGLIRCKGAVELAWDLTGGAYSSKLGCIERRRWLWSNLGKQRTPQRLHASFHLIMMPLKAPAVRQDRPTAVLRNTRRSFHLSR